MAEDSYMVPVRKAEIEIGKPLGFAVFDSEHNLLLNRGVVVTSENQVEVLLEKGLLRERIREKAGYVSARLDEDRAPVSKPQEEILSFEAIKLVPGDALQLQPMLEGQVERYTVHVIGVMKPKSVLVTAPVIDGRQLFVRDGTTYLVRAFSGLNVCAFKARVLKSQLQPFPYLHLSYPDSVQAMRIRKAMRAPAGIIVAVQATEGGVQIGSGKMVDISVGGARMISPMQLGQKGDALWLTFKVRLGDMEEYVKTPVVIRSEGPGEDDQGKAMKTFGIQFGELEQSQRLIIMNLVYQHMLKEGI